MEDGLRLQFYIDFRLVVLILVVMEDGLRRARHHQSLRRLGLNPCCNGRWSQTKTVSCLKR